MLQISLLEFAKSGMFGPIEVGMLRNEVELALGNPTHISPPSNNTSTADIWKYGDFEFHFFDDAVLTIFTDWFEVPQGGPELQIDPWILRARLARSDFEQALNQSNISFKKRPSRHNEDETEIITKGRVCFAFRDRENDWGPSGLCAFHTIGERTVGNE